MMRYSITIPAYKVYFFRECVESVLCQTYDDYEVVILNDCSPENVKEIVEECQKLKNGDKIRYYENEKNVGAINVVDNWNKLLELARGEYIICMGDDDMLTPECLEDYNKCINKYPDLEIYHARTYIINENSEIINIQEDRPDWESAYSIVWHAFKSSRMQFIGDFLFKRDALLERGGFYKLPMARGSDWVSGCIAASKKGIANSHTPTFMYRVNESTITTQTKGELLVDADIKYREWFLKFLAPEPNNDLDKNYRRILLKHIPVNLYNVNSKTIARDISSSPIRKWFHWYKQCNKYQISRKQYVHITFLSFLYVIKHLFKLTL